jgi:periplasmic protein TonB
MRALWVKLTGTSPSAESVGWGSSVLLHVAGAAVAATTFLAVAAEAPQLPGELLRTQIELQAEWFEPDAPPPTRIEPSDPLLVVMPTRARMAHREFSQESPDVSQPTAAELAWVERVMAEPVPARSQPSRATPPSGPAPTAASTESVPPRRPAPAAGVRTPRAEPSAVPVARPVSAGTAPQVPPRLRDNRPPDYPLEALRRRLEGTVLLRVHVATDGRVAEVDILDSSGHLILDAAAVRAVKSWHFVPATRGGRPVAAVVRQPVRFSLGE